MSIDPPIIDSHAHIFTARMPFVADAWIRPDYEYPVETYLADLDRYGISFGVIAAASLYGDYNDYTLWALRSHKRLRATIAPDPAAQLSQLQRLNDQGVVGVRLQLKASAPLPDIAGFEYRKYLNRLADSGMHLELNAGATQLSQLLPALKDSGVNVVVDHFGLLRSPDGIAGDGFQALLRALDYGNVWVKISAGFRLERELLHAAAEKLLVSAGADRLFWGSDAPFVGKEPDMSYAAALRIFQDLVPNAAIRRKISDAALRFYCF
jgi:predicted TIM-barrel fold metal-dependent hydrolase